MQETSYFEKCKFIFFCILACGYTSIISAEGMVDVVGGSLDSPAKGHCVSDQQRKIIQKNIEAYEKKYGKVSLRDKQSGEIEKYKFYPQAGSLWGDIFPNNFVDLDATEGIIDYECSGYTYDGHNGIDSGIVTWTQKDIGVPVYAALDGVVVDAADGFFDEQTTFIDDAKANYVILDHGNGHRTWYFHFRTDSVAVEINDFVKAGHQLGDTASSGYSTGPHLHFETRLNNTPFETFNGTCNQVESNWVEQPGFIRELYLREFNISNQDISSWTGPPVDSTRGAFFELGTQNIQWWVSVVNFPENASWKVRFIRPDGSIRFDSGDGNNFTNPFHRVSWWRWNYNINFDVMGTWKVELTLDDNHTVEAPIEVVQSISSAANRPPNDIDGLVFTPSSPSYEDAIRCTVDTSLLFRDPDYDQIRYRFEWKVDGQVVRDVTIAAVSDMLAAGTAEDSETIEVTVTPNDGMMDGNSITASPIVSAEVDSTVLVIY